MKWIGALLLISASASLGMYISSKLEKRPKHIRQLESALQLLEAEITYSHSPLKQAFLTIANQLPNPVRSFFQSLGEEMYKEDKDFTILWNEKIDELAKASSLKRNEMEVLKQFGHSLGQHDFLQQQKQIRLALTHLDRELEEAREEHYKYSQLAKSLGVLVGVFIVLLLV